MSVKTEKQLAEETMAMHGDLPPSDRRVRLAGLRTLPFNGRMDSKIPFFSPNPAIRNTCEDVWSVDKSKLYPDDLLKVALDCCESVRNPSPHLKLLGAAVMLAADARAVQIHGYSASEEGERCLEVSVEAILGDKESFLAHMASFHEEMTSLYRTPRRE